MKNSETPSMRKLTFVGTASSRRELLRSPVSGLPCVYWRLRIVEHVQASLQLVHELASPEDFELTWSKDAGSSDSGPPWPLLRALPASAPASAPRVRVSPAQTRIEGHPVLHRPGSPGAIAVGKQFGFLGMLSVEEIALRPGEEVVAAGLLDDHAARAASPYRAVEGELELLGATVRVPSRVTLGPALLPWALGTAAALLGGVGAATWAAWYFDLMPRFHRDPISLPAEMGPDHPTRRHFSQPAE